MTRNSLEDSYMNFNKQANNTTAFATTNAFTQNKPSLSTRIWQPPRVLEFSPSLGREGYPLNVTIDCVVANKKVNLGFGSFLVDTKITPMSTTGQPHADATTLTAIVPGFSLTCWVCNKVPVYAFVMDEHGLIEDSWYLGEFAYFDHGRQAVISNSMRPSWSIVDRSKISQVPTVAPAYHDQSEVVFNQLNQFNQLNPLDQFNQTNISQDSFQLIAGQANGQMHNPSAQRVTKTHDEFFNGMESPKVSSAGSLYQAVRNTKTGMPMTRFQDVDILANKRDFFDETGKTLDDVRKRIYTASPPEKPELRTSGQGAYGNGILFASDLNAMTRHWNDEEVLCNRRLVRFFFLNTSTNDEVDFEIVEQPCTLNVEENIVVSCIYWRERNGFYITSVDCIYLLERLIGKVFSVDEKNRIRRNLEGFRPMTVSKNRADSKDFFRMIMSFPHPKPRNIEKDLKVFCWKILPLALKKVSSKYLSSRNAQGGNMEIDNNLKDPEVLRKLILENFPEGKGIIASPLNADDDNQLESLSSLLRDAE